MTQPQRVTPAQYHAGPVYCCPICGEWKDGAHRPADSRLAACEECASALGEIPPGPLEIHDCPGCGVSNLYSSDGLPACEPVNPCQCETSPRDTSTDCGEVEIPGDLMARLNAEFDAIARRRAELATIRVSVNLGDYSALKNGGRSIEEAPAGAEPFGECWGLRNAWAKLPENNGGQS